MHLSLSSLSALAAIIATAAAVPNPKAVPEPFVRPLVCVGGDYCGSYDGHNAVLNCNNGGLVQLCPVGEKCVTVADVGNPSSEKLTCGGS
ncbi:hypothetical protein IMSHALPRED_000405 [Imshaugia aleurites]|uniref:Uncharacterized protein n=1 Tax=Imshaugia aleurites TaxID=172621 RepID=A0A8H3EWL4_9LECA|nr:hypothetical protein IMSHALPRED_000405 [Imshaugia aleurites]